jgi:hypothetical protein
VCQGQNLCLLADAALILQRYSLSGDWQAERALLPDELPTDPKLRKPLKPAFQADGRPLLVAHADDPAITSPLFTRDGLSAPARGN